MSIIIDLIMQFIHKVRDDAMVSMGMKKPEPKKTLGQKLKDKLVGLVKNKVKPIKKK